MTKDLQDGFCVFIKSILIYFLKLRKTNMNYYLYNIDITTIS